MSAFISALMQVLGASPSAMAQPQGSGRVALPEAPPIPQPRPASLPNRSLMPQRGPMESGPLGHLFGGRARDFIRSAGAGMANIGPTGGDPYLSFARGFGGAAGYDDAREAAAAKASIDADKLAYDRGRDAASDLRLAKKDAADPELRRLAEERQARTTKLTNRKTALEIRREARANRITVKQQLEIERITHAVGENIIDPAERRAAVEAERKRLTEQVTSGHGISGAQPLSGESEITATNHETGEQKVLRNGEWVAK